MASKNRAEGRLLILIPVIVSIILLQIIALWFPNAAIYWKVYDSSNDLLIMALSIALFQSIHYSLIRLKITTLGLIVWFIYVSLSNLMTDYGLVNVNDSSLAALFMTMAVFVIYSFRFVFKWSHRRTAVYADRLYLITSKPTNLSQLFVAVYTGAGGAFGITDGTNVWHYSKQACAMIVTPLEKDYLIGRNVQEICDLSNDRVELLDSMVGTKFSMLNNCLKLKKLAENWREK